MDAKKHDTACSRDAISNLPDEVLGKILSLLPTKQAASTSVLSKKWRNVFALVDNLDFDDSVLLQPKEGKEERDVIFRRFVDRTLALQCDSPIKKFSLKYHTQEMAYVCRWLCNAVERGVSELDVSLKPRYEEFMLPDFENVKIHLDKRSHSERFLPCELFRSKTLVKLTLVGKRVIAKLPLDVSLPALKYLLIDSVSFENKGDLSKVLLPGCPVLEELLVRHKEFVGHPNRICSRSIKKLSVHYDSEHGGCLSKAMSFDAPSLVSLDYSDYALSEYPQVNLASLVEARLDLRSSWSIIWPEISGLIIGISNVETLHLSPDAVNVIFGCFGQVLPEFNNLVSLSFGSEYIECWRLLSHLLKQSPKLETLIIQDLNSYRGGVTLSRYKVKVLRVLNYGGSAQELKHLKRFIGGTECLKLVRVEIAKANVVDDTYIDLMTLLRFTASPMCEIQVEYMTS